MTFVLCLAFAFVAQDPPEWKALGDSAEAAGLLPEGNKDYAQDPAIIHDADGNPIVAWTQRVDEGRRTIRVKRWDGAAWREMPDGSAGRDGVSGKGDSAKPAL